MTDTNDLLKQGIAALKAGHKAEARRLLEQVVQRDKRNETAWLWLSGAVDTDEERCVCLENVLSINPSNELARCGLARLEASWPVRSPDSVKAPAPRAGDEPLARMDISLRPEPAAPKQVAVPSRPAFQKPEIKRAKKKGLTSTQWLLLSGAGVMMLSIFCCLIGVLWPSPPQSVTSYSSPGAATSTPLPPLPRTTTTGKWAFTITGVDLLDVIETPSKRYRPEKGIYLVILGTVANASDENETFKFSDWKLQDANGIRYEVDDDTTEAAKTIYNLDYPGWILGLRVEYDYSRETYVLFDVPSDAKELQLYFKGGTTPLILGDMAYLTRLAETTGIPTPIPTPTNTPVPTATMTRVFPAITPTMPPVPTDTPSTISPGEFDDETIATMIEIVCSPYGVTNVEIADGRLAGGDRVAIVTLETDTADLDKIFSGLGAVFGAAYEACTGEVQADLDAVDIVVGNMNGIATAIVSVKMSDIGAWKAGRITDEQFLTTWLITDL